MILVDEVKPDVVMLDWMIEGISGIEVCRRLRRRATTANVPIIMLTARGEESDRIRGFETGADDYVTKPFSPRELVARVGAVLRRVRPALAGERLAYADVEMDVAATGCGAAASRSRSARPSSGCCAISSSIPAGSSRASGCSMRSGATIPTSSCAPSTSISGGCARRSTMGDRSDLIRTVRSAGYSLDAEH